MTATRPPVLFDYSAVPMAADWQRVVDHARLVDELGLDLIGIQDHPYQLRFLDTPALLTFIGAQTKRLRLVPDVINIQLRPPAVLAKWAASVDLMTGGRVELGLGAGGFPQAVAAMGAKARQGGEAVDALEEAIAVIRLMWSGQRGVRFDGRYYTLQGVHSGPVPAHSIGIWIGAYKPRMLALTGRLADGWLPSLGYLTPEVLDEANRRIDEAAQAAGRDPSAIRRLINVGGYITDGESTGDLEGPIDQWVDRLSDLTLAHGFDGYVFWPADDSEAQLRRFAVVPDFGLRSNLSERSLWHGRAARPDLLADRAREVGDQRAGDGRAGVGGCEERRTPGPSTLDLWRRGVWRAKGRGILAGDGPWFRPW